MTERSKERVWRVMALGYFKILPWHLLEELRKTIEIFKITGFLAKI